MLYAFGFERVGVVVGDLYFVNPRAARGQEGAEHGVRLELRLLDRGPLKGSAYSAQTIETREFAARLERERPCRHGADQRADALCLDHRTDQDRRAAGL